MPSARARPPEATGERAETRLVLAVSLDGRLAPPAGGAAQLGGPGDRRVLEEALAWADACLIGAQTLRLHGTTCLIHAADLLALRQQQGRSPQPVAIAVSRSGQLPAELPFFAQPLERWLLACGAGADRPVAGGFARQLRHHSWPATLAALAAAGLRRVLLLGGAQLASGLLQADCVDGLQLTVCPLWLGGPHTWIPPQGVLPPEGAASGWQLEEHRALQGGELLLRYRRIPPL